MKVETFIAKIIHTKMRKENSTKRIQHNLSSPSLQGHSEYMLGREQM